MSEISKFWLTGGATGDQVAGYNWTDLQEFNRTMFLTNALTEAVAKGLYGDLAVTAGSGLVAVAAGIANVYGHWYKSDLAFNISIPTPASATRIDRIVLRANMTGSTFSGQVGYTVKCVRVAGAEGTGLAPTLTQNANQWEVSLATVSITTGAAITVTDTRVYMNPPIQINGANLTSTFTYTGTFMFSKSGAGLLINDTSQTTDEKLWDFATLAQPTGKAMLFRAVNDAKNAATTWLQVNRGTGVAVSNATFGVPLILSSSLSVATTSTFLAGVTLSNASPNFFINSSSQTTDEKLWLMGVNVKNFYIVAINDALNSTKNIISAQRGTGTAITSISIGESGIPVAFPGGLAADTVDDAAAGSRVVVLARRQGGSATDWNSGGATDYTTGMVRMQAGTKTIVSSGAVTFPIAFSTVPIVLLSSTQSQVVYPSSITASGFTINVGGGATATTSWIAVGTE